MDRTTTCHQSQHWVHRVRAEESVGIFELSAVRATRPRVPCPWQRRSVALDHAPTVGRSLVARLSTATLRVPMTEESAAHHGADEGDSDWPNAVHG